MNTQILRWDVPVDDAWHEIGAGPVALVAIRDLGDSLNFNRNVEVWTWEHVQDPPFDTRLVRVFGTGHHVPDGAFHLGSAVVPGVRLVWHVFTHHNPPS